MPGVSQVGCRTHSRVLSHARPQRGPPLPVEKEGERYKHTQAGCPALALQEEASCRCLQLGQEARGDNVGVPGGARLPASIPPCQQWLPPHTSQTRSWQGHQPSLQPSGKGRGGAGCELVSSVSHAAAYPGCTQTWPCSSDCKHSFPKEHWPRLLLPKTTQLFCRPCSTSQSF